MLHEAKFPPPSGFLIIDKPHGITSRDAVDHVQHWFPRTKLGHAGTLDPGATGVLVVGVGSSATRLIEYIQDQEKVYLTTIRLGGTSTTDDADGEITLQEPAQPPDQITIQQALHQFLGEIQQTPPAFSAAKVDGIRAHTKARRGEQVQLQPRTVTIHEIVLQSYEYPWLKLEIRCSKGTYIRSIARDLGQSLGIGGYVQQLRRTRIGSLTCDHAIPWEASTQDVHSRLLPLSTAATHLPRCPLSHEEALRLQQGQLLRKEQQLPQSTVALWQNQNFIGIAHYDAKQYILKPLKILAH